MKKSETVRKEVWYCDDCNWGPSPSDLTTCFICNKDICSKCIKQNGLFIKEINQLCKKCKKDFWKMFKQLRKDKGNPLDEETTLDLKNKTLR